MLFPTSPTHCEECGRSLAGATATGTEIRRVFDLPERRREVTEHYTEWRWCGCGGETGGTFPPEATAPAVWGATGAGPRPVFDEPAADPDRAHG